MTKSYHDQLRDASQKSEDRIAVPDFVIRSFARCTPGLQYAKLTRQAQLPESPSPLPAASDFLTLKQIKRALRSLRTVLVDLVGVRS